MHDLSGHSIKGYALHELIGMGGFGAVYRAYQPSIKRDVAMKIILPEHANHPDFIRRFEFEAQLIARLEHIHIVPLYDYWRDPDGAYLIMRWLRGGSLRGLLKQGPLDNEKAARIVDQVASALAVAHRRGVVHRDIKPDNILFDEDGNAYLADFGIAKDLLDAASTLDSAAEDNELTGSPYYISPEQAQSQPITPQTDLYSLGIVLYEMLVGQPPFASDQGLMGVLLKQINDPVPSLKTARPDLPQLVDAVIQRATAKLPASRYPDALSLAVDFRQALLAAPTSAAVPPRPAAGVPEQVSVLTKPLPSLVKLTVPDIDNPYKGLQPFEEADAADFFGREALVDQLLERLGEPGGINRFLAVIGPSGSGKSSVVKAGLVPKLRKGALPGSDRWFLAEIVPGADPFRELETALLAVATQPLDGLLDQLHQDERGLLHAVERALPAGDNELLLVIDQFEEVFTLVPDEAARALFLNSLLVAITEPNSRLRVIVTLRADFYDRPLLYAGFGELVRKRNEVVLPLATDEMEQAIVGPARRAGMTVEAGLVAAIVAEISEQPGALPLLQYALTEVFEHRQGNIMTLDAYYASGGVLGALARRAEELFQVMSTAGQEAMRQLFLRLVTLGEGTEDTRRRVTRTELMSVLEEETVLSEVLNTLGKYRLLTFDRDPQTRIPTVEVAHEALIREWSRLRGWLDSSRDDIRLQRRLTAAADEWHNQGRDASFLAAGVRLQQVEALLESGSIALTPDEIEYVQASIARRAAQEAAEAARLAREAALERRSRNRLRALAAVGLVAAVITSVLAVLAFLGFQNAEDQRKHAERSAAVSDSLALSASAQKELVSHNNDLAIALALKANAISDPPREAQQILAQSALAPGTRRVFTGHEGVVFGGVFSPDGTTALSGSEDMTLILWDVATGQIIRRLAGHTAPVRAVAFSPDGKVALSGAEDNLVMVWDVETGALIRTLEGHTASVRTVAFSPDGTWALSGGEDNAVILWEVGTGALVRRFEGHTDWVRAVAFSPDGTTALSGAYDKSIILWDVATGEALHTYTMHGAEVTSVAFSRDGQSALSGSGDRTIRLWDIATGEEIQRFVGHGSWVKSVGFSPDGRMVLSSSDDNSVRLWEIASGDEFYRFVGHSDFVEQAVFSPDGMTVLSSSGDRTLRLWDVTSGAEVRRFNGHTDGVLSVDLSPDGKTALSGSFDATVRLWDVATGAQIGQFDGHTEAVGLVLYSPDGQSALSSSDTTLLVWDVPTGEIKHTLAGHDDLVLSAAFSPDGKTALSGALDTKVILWNLETGEAIKTLQGHDFAVNSVAFSPDGQSALSSAEDGTIILWNLDSGEPIRRFEGHSGAVNSVMFSPDGQTALSASQDTRILLWDVATGSILRRLEGHTAAVRRAVFSADGQMVLSGSDDGTLRVWRVADGLEIRRLDQGPAVWSVDYSPDAQSALSGSSDATMRLWDATPLSLDRLLGWIYANRTVPDLTCVQRAQYHVGPPCDAGGAFPTSTPYPAP